MRRVRSGFPIRLMTFMLSLLVLGQSGLFAQSVGSISTVAGTGADTSSGDGEPAVQAGVRAPHGLAFDLAGNLFIAEHRGERVRMMTPAGLIRTFAGTGEAGFSGDGGPATKATLSAPRNLAVDMAGNLFITDHQNLRVRRVSPDGIMSTAVGSGRRGYSNDGVAAWEASVDELWGVALDSLGRLHVAVNNRIRRVYPSGILQTLGGSDRWETAGDGGPVALATFASPGGLAFDQVGNLYITELLGNCVRKVGVDGVIRTVAGTGVPGSAGDNGPATSAELNAPYAIAVDSANTLFVTDTYGHRVRKISPDGTITTVAGNGASGYSGDGGPADRAQLSYPSGVAIDARGDLYIADWGNHRVRKVVGVAARGLLQGTPIR